MNHFQCGNYGIGGHYGTHPDFYDYDESKFYDPESKINRISTVMAVLEAPEAGEHFSIFMSIKWLSYISKVFWILWNNVVLNLFQTFWLEGGATVWPFVGVYVMPEKGSAAAWFNTRTDAHVDLETQHAACPVLLGQKWSKIIFWFAQKYHR